MRPNALTSCQTKKSYPSEDVAKDVALYIWDKSGKDLKVYKCSICEQYHLTRNR